MCGRYFVGDEEKTAEMKQIISTLTKKLGPERALGVKTSGEVFPTDVVPVLAQNRVYPMQWGFVQNDGRSMINARSETAGVRSMFKNSFAEMRCLIPAAGYYEWWKNDSARCKCAFSNDRAMIYMAGIYRFESGAAYPRFVILTRQAAPGIAFIHDRMPVLLDGEARREWLLGSDPAGTLKKAVLDIAFKTA